MAQKVNSGDIRVAVDIVIFTVKENALQVILIQMQKKPFTGMWAFPGGVINPRESLDDAAIRELRQKTGVSNVYLEQLYTFGEPKRDPYGRVISVVYFALILSEGIDLKTIEKYSDIRWFDVRNLPRLAYDHREIARYALKRLQWKVEYTNVVYSLLPKYFTLSELQEVYEVILARKLDRRNFQRKIKSINIVRPTKKSQTGKHRPAVLYEFAARKPRLVEVI